MAKRYKIISLRAQAKGFVQRDVKSAGQFNSYEEACQAAEELNQDSNRIYTTYMAVEVTRKTVDEICAGYGKPGQKKESK